MTPPRPDRSDLTDDELVRLVCGGETDAFAEIVRRTRRSAYLLARRITRNHEDADDVVQDSYVKAFRALDRFTPGAANVNFGHPSSYSQFQTPRFYRVQFAVTW